MNEFGNESGMLPEGFSAVKMEELDQIEGGIFGWIAAGVGAVAVGFCIGYTAGSLIKKAVE